VLKPQEFQRIMLIRLGKQDLANRLGDAGGVFGPSGQEAVPCGELDAGHLDHGLLDQLLPFFQDKSYLGPPVRRRIIISMKTEPRSEQLTEVNSPLLSKVSSAYNWYRREQMKLAGDTISTVLNNPSLHGRLHGIDVSDAFSKTAEMPNLRTTALILGSVPLALMYSAHKRTEREQGTQQGLIARLVADHPWLTALGLAVGLKQLLTTPQGQQAVDEVFAAANRVWRGKQAIQVAG